MARQNTNVSNSEQNSSAQSTDEPVIVECLAFWMGAGPDPQRVPVVDVLIKEAYATSGLLSSSTNVDFVSEKFVDEIGMKKTPLPYECLCQTMFSKVPIFHTVDLKFDINGISTYRTCHVFPGMGTDLIFGFQFQKDFPYPITDINNRTFNGLPMHNP